MAAVSKSRQDALRVALPNVVVLLRQRRASEIDDEDIDDLVSLSWLEWIGGSLQPTATGNNICKQQQAR